MLPASSAAWLGVGGAVAHSADVGENLRGPDTALGPGILSGMIRAQARGLRPPADKAGVMRLGGWARRGSCLLDRAEHLPSIRRLVSPLVGCFL